MAPRRVVESRDRHYLLPHNGEKGGGRYIEMRKRRWKRKRKFSERLLATDGEVRKERYFERRRGRALSASAFFARS
jgi:hypothetical protein